MTDQPTAPEQDGPPLVAHRAEAEALADLAREDLNHDDPTVAAATAALAGVHATLALHDTVAELLALVERATRPIVLTGNAAREVSEDVAAGARPLDDEVRWRAEDALTQARASRVTFRV